MNRFLDFVADRLALDDLQRNKRPVRLTSFLSLSLLFLPAVLFLVLLELNPRGFNVWQFWGIAFFGLIATAGGTGDWIFHKVYVTVGPHEHHSHILALGAGGIVFVLMAIAWMIEQPLDLLIPVIIALLVTVTLICYDEFAFHTKRCKSFETGLHWMLVFGNGAAFLCWLHWIFVYVRP
jgi:hypothetical protein